MDGKPDEFLCGLGKNPGVHGAGDELHPQADAQNRLARFDHRAHKGFFRGKPRGQFSALTLIGPPRITRKSTASGSGKRGVLNARVRVRWCLRVCIQAPILSRPSKGTCWMTCVRMGFSSGGEPVLSDPECTALAAVVEEGTGCYSSGAHGVCALARRTILCICRHKPMRRLYSLRRGLTRFRKRFKGSMKYSGLSCLR